MWAPPQRGCRTRSESPPAERGLLGDCRVDRQRPTYPHSSCPGLGQGGDRLVARVGQHNGSRLFRCVCRAGKTWGQGVTERVVWHVVKDCAKQAGIEKLAPHDLRRTCARLCHEAGGELEQIQFLLGHVSVQTTEKYLGCKQRLREAVNDHIGIEPSTRN